MLPWEIIILGFGAMIGSLSTGILLDKLMAKSVCYIYLAVYLIVDALILFRVY
jgi:predicted MFS family arabinose efflux permease